MRVCLIPIAGCLMLIAACAACGEAEITVRTDRVLHRLSRYLTGACIEDVNHEIYGGIYSQMVFGESFQEPPPAEPPTGFAAWGGQWDVREGELHAGAGDGPRLSAPTPPADVTDASVEVRFDDMSGGNAGLIVRHAATGVGADAFAGYEISLDIARQCLVVGRHQRNWQHIADTPLSIPVDHWLRLAVRTTSSGLTVRVDGREAYRCDDLAQPLPTGGVALRTWRRAARFRRFTVNGAAMPFRVSDGRPDAVSGMWRPFRRGAQGAFTLDGSHPFIGARSQRISFESGEGEVGIENRGLNRWGLHIEAAKPYEGWLWVRPEGAQQLTVALETGDGARRLAEHRIRLAGREWRRAGFRLTPREAAEGGRFAISLSSPGAASIGYVMLQPGSWGRFRGLPLRRDVVRGLIDQGVTVLRYGGSMVNTAEYRWKKMIGPRDRRPPYCGFWYPHSTNGWGVIDFLDLCDAAGFLAIPALNMDESPADIADFVEYVNGAVTSEWGRRRAADGHAAPYRLRHIELGNEERIDAEYFRRFRALAEAIWRKDPEITVVVGDFVYEHEITAPMRLTGSVAGLATMETHRDILSLARTHDREVWFDVHIGTNDPELSPSGRALGSYLRALEQLADGARFRVAVFEFNAGNHRMRRALGNALAINEVHRLGERMAVACSANGLQPDGQNDNDWDQGLLFLNPASVWLQPPGWLTRMVSRSYLPLMVACTVDGGGPLDVVARRSDDGREAVVQVVNPDGRPASALLRMEGMAGALATSIETLAGGLDDRNTADAPHSTVPIRASGRRKLPPRGARFTFPAHSVTILRVGPA